MGGLPLPCGDIGFLALMAMASPSGPVSDASTSLTGSLQPCWSALGNTEWVRSLSDAQLADNLLWVVALAFHGCSRGQVWGVGKLS